MRYEKKDTYKPLIVSLVVFLIFLIPSVFCYGVSSSQKTEWSLPYFLSRQFLYPVMFLTLGLFLSKAIHHFWGASTKIPASVSRCVKIAILVLLGANVVLVVPYFFWYMTGLAQAISGDGVSLIFPYLRIYSEAAQFFLTVMYRVPVLYTVVGFCLGAFPLSKRS